MFIFPRMIVRQNKIGGRDKELGVGCNKGRPCAVWEGGGGDGVDKRKKLRT